ncbi:hypothetical protein EMIT079MI2_50123 [Bacillus sp. IT-79MI2]
MVPRKSKGKELQQTKRVLLKYLHQIRDKNEAKHINKSSHVDYSYLYVFILFSSFIYCRY